MKAYIANNKDLLELSIGDRVIRKIHPYIGDVPKIIDVENEPSYLFRELINKEKVGENYKLTFITESGYKEEYFIRHKYGLGIHDSYERTYQNMGYSLYSLKEHSITEKDIYVTCIPSRTLGMDDEY